jgi:hypothetical protein
VSCKGHWGNATKAAITEMGVDHGITYAFACTQNVRSFTVITTRPVDAFAVDTLSVNAQTHATGVIFLCEGLIPGDGVNCAGDKTTDLNKAGYVMRGNLGVDAGPCSYDSTAPGLFNASLIVADATGKMSGPFPLRRPSGCATRYKRELSDALRKARAHS